jgi:hypothetical protein
MASTAATSAGRSDTTVLHTMSRSMSKYAQLAFYTRSAEAGKTQRHGEDPLSVPLCLCVSPRLRYPPRFRVSPRAYCLRAADASRVGRNSEVVR